MITPTMKNFIKNTQILAIVGIVFLVHQLTCANAFAQHQKRKKAGPSTVVSELAETGSAGSSSFRFGVGFASYSLGAFSAWYQLNESASIQGLVSITSTSPFQFSTGALFRYTVHGTEKTGLHVGGGFSLGILKVGAAKPFLVNIHPIAGFHYTIPGLNNILFSFDGGPDFRLVDGSFNFSTDALPLSPLGTDNKGTLLGLSIHYFF